MSNWGLGFRPGVVTVQPIQHETHTAEGLRRDLVSKGFNLDYLLIICPICPLTPNASGLIHLCWMDVFLQSRWKKVAPQGLHTCSPAASSLLLLSFFFDPAGVWSSVWVMLGYGAKQDTGAAAETPRTRPEAERNSQEHAAHYPPMWLLLGEDS